MSNHLSARDIERYLEQAMLPAELLAADDHLADCASCYGQIDQRQLHTSLKSVESAIEEVADITPNHLDYDQLVSYVDERLAESERKTLNSHLQVCSRCETELNELQAFRARMSAYLEKSYAPAAARIASKRSAFWSAPAYRVPLRWAGAAAAIVLFLVIATLPLRKEIADLQAKVNDLQQNNEALATQVAAARELHDQLTEAQKQNERLLKELDNSSHVVLALNDGDTRVTLDEHGNLLGLSSATAVHQQMASSALKAGQVKTPAFLRRLTGEPGKLMGGGGSESYGLISPVGSVIETDRPIFRWSQQSGAESYVVTIFDSRSKKVASSGPLSGSEWTVPTSLERGRTYSWQVRTVVGGNEVVLPPPAAPDAQFKVLERAKADELERARQTNGKSHLLLGVLYADAGLLEDSEREFRALVNANPQSSIAQKLLRSVTSQKQNK